MSTNSNQKRKYNNYLANGVLPHFSNLVSQKMVLLDKMWDEVIAGPSPDKGLGKLRKLSTKPLVIKDERGESSIKRSLSMPATPGTPVTPTAPSPTAVKNQNVWRSVFHPGSNINTRHLGADLFDRPQPNSPTVYDWLYSGETKSTHR